MAHTEPALFLHGAVNIDYATDFNADPTSPAIGAAFKWAASIFVNPQAIGVPLDTFTFAYDGTHVKVGDWVASSEFGRALRVAEIVSADVNFISVILEDVDSYNALTDTSGAFDGSIPSNTCVVFTLNEFGFPILGPLNEFTFPANAQGNLLARFNFVGDYTFPGGSGGSDFLGDPTDGSYDDGAVKGWTPGVTRKDDAIDALNRYLAKALPERPRNISDVELSFTNQPNGTFNPARTLESFSWRLADGLIPSFVPGVTFSYKDEIIPIDSILATTTDLTEVGNGDSGTLSVAVNGTITGSHVMTSGDDVGSYTGLDVITEYLYPLGNPAAVWNAMDIRATATVPDGINRFTVSHTETGSTYKDIVVEPLQTTPVISFPGLVPGSHYLRYVSGVPHLLENSEFTVSMSVENLVGRTYIASETLGTCLNDNSFFVALSGDTITNTMNIDLPVLAPLTAFSWTGLTGKHDRSIISPIDFFAMNSFAETRVASNFTAIIASEFKHELDLHETSIFVGIQEGIKRVATPDGDCPVINSVSFDPDWDEGNVGDLGDLSPWEAPIVGGRATADRTDYSTGHIPVGPDFTGKPACQYITFKIKRITNRLKLHIDGTYTGLFVKLPGIPQAMPTAVNGWWNGMKQADNAPLDWPGHSNNNDGCLLTKNEEAVEFTFGNVSSASSTDNVILIRFILEGDDVIRNIRIVE